MLDSTCDETVLSSTAVWSDKTLELRDLTDTNGIPGVFRILKGQYKDKLPSNIIYIDSIQTGEKVLAEGVKVAGRQLTAMMEKFSIPVTYLGWFEVLSEDGKPIQPMTSVQQLAKAFPQYCLVREHFTALTSSNTVEDAVVDKSRTVVAGEKLHLVDDTWLDEQSAKGIVKKRYLRCIDEKGTNVYLSLEQKAVFSPIAGHNNISGVHNIRGLVEKFRLPITVRLVFGNMPAKAEKTLPIVLRLLGVYVDETAFVLPLVKKDSKLVTISTLESVVLAPTKNISALRKSKEFLAVHRKATKLLSAYMDSIHILVNALPRHTLTINRTDVQLKDQVTPTKSVSKSASREMKSTRKEESDDIFDEIDDIYRYVRVGGPPPIAGANRTTVKDVDPLLDDPLDEFQWMEQTADLPEERNEEDQGKNTPSKIDDCNWDEPIYEDIAKIKERKRQRKYATQEKIDGVIGGDDKPIPNLRELIKRFSNSDGRGTQDHPKREIQRIEDEKTSAAEFPPRIPQKRIVHEGPRPPRQQLLKSKGTKIIPSTPNTVALPELSTTPNTSSRNPQTLSTDKDSFRASKYYNPGTLKDPDNQQLQSRSILENSRLTSPTSLDEVKQSVSPHVVLSSPIQNLTDSVARRNVVRVRAQPSVDHPQLSFLTAPDNFTISNNPNPSSMAGATANQNWFTSTTPSSTNVQPSNSNTPLSGVSSVQVFTSRIYQTDTKGRSNGNIGVNQPADQGSLDVVNPSMPDPTGTLGRTMAQFSTLHNTSRSTTTRLHTSTARSASPRIIFRTDLNN